MLHPPSLVDGFSHRLTLYGPTLDPQPNLSFWRRSKMVIRISRLSDTQEGLRCGEKRASYRYLIAIYRIRRLRRSHRKG